MPTRNRASFIGATLDRIIEQATDECEIVVVDGASTDNTEVVVEARAKRFPRLRYVRQPVRDGLERGFDRAVELAAGEYCWLMPDDDLLMPGAVAKVLSALQGGQYGVVLMNSEFRTIDMKTSMGVHDPNIKEDRVFRGDELDALFEASWNMIRYGGSTVMLREVWVRSEREHLMDLYFPHIGIMFQKPLPGEALVMAEPQIMIRMQNQSWLSGAFDAFFVAWPAIVKSLAISDSTKESVLGKTVSTASVQAFCLYRAAGQYSWREYRQYVRPYMRSALKRWAVAMVARAPRWLVRALVLVKASVFDSRIQRGTVLRMLRQSDAQRIEKSMAT
jgi:abequosyltransferase